MTDQAEKRWAARSIALIPWFTAILYSAPLSPDCRCKGTAPSGTAADLLAVFSSGAYVGSMASNYDSRRQPAEVMVAGEQVLVLRRRERFEYPWAAEMES